MNISQEDVANRLLWPLWRCLDEGYKDRYKREIWDHFENAVRSAAYTGKLSTYLSNFQGRIPTTLQLQHMKDINSIVSSGQDVVILDWLRDETTYMVMLVRLKNQTRREDWIESQADFSEQLTDQEDKNKELFSK